MQQLFWWLRQQFGFTRTEIKGFLMIVFALSGLWSFNVLLPIFRSPQTSDFQLEKDRKLLDCLVDQWKNSIAENPSKSKEPASSNALSPFPFDPNTLAVEGFEKLGLPSFLAKRIEKYRNSGGSFKVKNDFGKIYGISEKDFAQLKPFIQLPEKVERKRTKKEEREIVLFEFDPNRLSAEGFVKLGLPLWMGERIVKYRNKGGSFKVKSDLQKIYGFRESDYLRLAPYLLLPDTLSNNPVEEEVAEKDFPKKKTLAPFDLNTADTVQLKAIRGIGKVLSQRIVEYRESLGGFHSKSQLSEVYGLKPEVLEKLKETSFIEAPIQTIKINRLPLDALKVHRYISYKMAKLIVAYRKQHGNYQTADDLLKIKAITPEEVEKLKPYLSFE